jgi:hypothetical protein
MAPAPHARCLWSRAPPTSVRSSRESAQRIRGTTASDPALAGPNGRFAAARTVNAPTHVTATTTAPASNKVQFQVGSRVSSASNGRKAQAWAEGAPSLLLVCRVRLPKRGCGCEYGPIGQRGTSPKLHVASTQHCPQNARSWPVPSLRAWRGLSHIHPQVRSPRPRWLRSPWGGGAKEALGTRPASPPAKAGVTRRMV